MCCKKKNRGAVTLPAGEPADTMMTVMMIMMMGKSPHVRRALHPDSAGGKPRD
jgi:hypothetical protein